MSVKSIELVQNFWTITELLSENRTISRFSGTSTFFRCKTLFPEFLESSLSIVVIQISVSRTAEKCSTCHYDPLTPRHEVLERAQHVGKIDRAGPEFLDHHRITV